MDWLELRTSLPTPEAAQSLADILVSERLAACVQISSPIHSRFVWNGALEAVDEWLCCMKTRADLFPALEKRISELHPYEVPEIIATPLTHITERYRLWLEECLSSPGPTPTDS